MAGNARLRRISAVRQIAARMAALRCLIRYPCPRSILLPVFPVCTLSVPHPTGAFGIRAFVVPLLECSIVEQNLKWFWHKE